MSHSSGMKTATDSSRRRSAPQQSTSLARDYSGLWSRLYSTRLD